METSITLVYKFQELDCLDALNAVMEIGKINSLTIVIVIAENVWT